MRVIPRLKLWLCVHLKTVFSFLLCTNCRLVRQLQDSLSSPSLPSWNSLLTQIYVRIASWNINIERELHIERFVKKCKWEIRASTASHWIIGCCSFVELFWILYCAFKQMLWIEMFESKALFIFKKVLLVCWNVFSKHVLYIKTVLFIWKNMIAVLLSELSRFIYLFF